MTDALKVISENSTGAEERHAMSKRWIDLFEAEEDVSLDLETAKEKADNIITDFKKRLNRKEVK